MLSSPFSSLTQPYPPIVTYFLFNSFLPLFSSFLPSFGSFSPSLCFFSASLLSFALFFFFVSGTPLPSRSMGFPLPLSRLCSFFFFFLSSFFSLGASFLFSVHNSPFPPASFPSVRTRFDFFFFSLASLPPMESTCSLLITLSYIPIATTSFCPPLIFHSPLHFSPPSLSLSSFGPLFVFVNISFRYFLESSLFPCKFAEECVYRVNSFTDHRNVEFSISQHEMSMRC